MNDLNITDFDIKGFLSRAIKNDEGKFLHLYGAYKEALTKRNELEKKQESLGEQLAKCNDSCVDKEESINSLKIKQKNSMELEEVSTIRAEKDKIYRDLDDIKGLRDNISSCIDNVSRQLATCSDTVEQLGKEYWGELCRCLVDTIMSDIVEDIQLTLRLAHVANSLYGVHESPSRFLNRHLAPLMLDLGDNEMQAIRSKMVGCIDEVVSSGQFSKNSTQ